MKVTIKHAEESTLEEFAAKHGFEMVVEESPLHPKGSSQLYSARLTGPGLRYFWKCGLGDTPEKAIEDYASRISGTKIETDEVESACMFFAVYKIIEVPRLVKK